MVIAQASIARGDVYLVRLDPTLGSEIKKTRPCVVISPDELNDHLRTIIVAPMTTGGRAYPWRPRCRFQGRAGFVALDQLRTIDAERLVKLLGQLDPQTVLAVLRSHTFGGTLRRFRSLSSSPRRSCQAAIARGTILHAQHAVAPARASEQPVLAHARG